MHHYSLLLEPAPQTVWTDWKFILQMTFGAAGGGLYLAGAVTLNPLACFLGLILAVGAKGAFLFKELGRPERFLKYFLRPFSSSVSFGGWAVVLFGLFGLLYWAVLALPISPGLWPTVAVKGLAIFFALVVITYDGLILAGSKAVSAWSSGLLAPLFAVNALAFGSAVVMPAGGALRVAVTFGLLLTELVVLLCHLSALRGGPAGSRAALALLTRGEEKWMFLGGAVLAGLLAPLAILTYQVLGGAELAQGLLVLTALMKAGGLYCLRDSILKSGMIIPVL